MSFNIFGKYFPFCFLYETPRGPVVTELLSSKIFYFDLIVMKPPCTWPTLTLAANTVDYNRYYNHHQILEISLFCLTTAMGIFQTPENITYSDSDPSPLIFNE